MFNMIIYIYMEIKVKILYEQIQGNSYVLVDKFIVVDDIECLKLLCFLVEILSVVFIWEIGLLVF